MLSSPDRYQPQRTTTAKGCDIMKEKAEFSFVILHYLVMDQTVNAVNSIKENMASYSFHIVIVDNGSPNESGRALEEKYKDDEEVTVILAGSNLGFSSGNDLGYSWCRDNLSQSFICIMNNDTAITSPSFAEKVREIYSRTSCAVLGPDIYCPITDKHQSPSGLSVPSKQSVSEKFERRREMNRFFPLSYLRLRREAKRKRNMVHPKDSWWKEGREDVTLHGAFYIFCPPFITQMETAFLPLGFMYFEEETLCYVCNKKGLKIVYSPEIQIFHYDDKATNRAFGTGYRKAKFKSFELEKSIKALLDYMSEA